ncbi:hypothetical protein VV11_015670 [Trichodesmium erythraeum 21-75]|nr:hypothetical protein [Trichodesmium erythraeum 21-75]
MKAITRLFFLIIFVSEGFWSGDDLADNVQGQHHDSAFPDYTNDYGFDSNISLPSYVGDIDCLFYFLS